jgi:hypothetical protein
VPEDGSPQDPRFTATLDLLRRMGASEVQIRYDEEQDPIFWLVVGRWGDTYEGDTALTPLRAAVRLAERVGDGGVCAFCARPAAVSDDWRAPTILDEHFCWWVYDPETESFRRGCEAEHGEKQIKQRRPVGRNDPCPCGSGKKYKRCCG